MTSREYIQRNTDTDEQIALGFMYTSVWKGKARDKHGEAYQLVLKTFKKVSLLSTHEREKSHLSWRLLFRRMLFPEVFESTSKLQYVLVRVFEISMMVRYQDWLMWIIGIQGNLRMARFGFREMNALNSSSETDLRGIWWLFKSFLINSEDIN